MSADSDGEVGGAETKGLKGAEKAGAKRAEVELACWRGCI